MLLNGHYNRHGMVLQVTAAAINLLLHNREEGGPFYEHTSKAYQQLYHHVAEAKKTETTPLKIKAQLSLDASLIANEGVVDSSVDEALLYDALYHARSKQIEMYCSHVSNGRQFCIVRRLFYRTDEGMPYLLEDDAPQPGEAPQQMTLAIGLRIKVLSTMLTKQQNSTLSPPATITSEMLQNWQSIVHVGHQGIRVGGTEEVIVSDATALVRKLLFQPKTVTVTGSDAGFQHWTGAGNAMLLFNQLCLSPAERTWCFAFLKLEAVLCNVNTQALLLHKEIIKTLVIEPLIDRQLTGRIGSNRLVYDVTESDHNSKGEWIQTIESLRHFLTLNTRTGSEDSYFETGERNPEDTQTANDLAADWSTESSGRSCWRSSLRSGTCSKRRAPRTRS